MDYYNDLDRLMELEAQHAEDERAWDHFEPEWRTLSVDPENRDVIAYADVDDPDAAFTRYGSDDPGRWTLHPGAYGMDSI